jgi:hypothetical protein
MDMLEAHHVTAHQDQVQQLLVAFGVPRHGVAGGIGDPKSQGGLLGDIYASLRQFKGVAVFGGHQPAGQFIGGRILPRR